MADSVVVQSSDVSQPSSDANALQKKEIDIPHNEEQEFQSLEYEEDCFYTLLSKTETPSFDPEDPNWNDDNDCLFVIVEEEFDEPSSLDLEDINFTDLQITNVKTSNNKFIRGIRVKFQDLSKPYLARIVNAKKYYRFLHLRKGKEPASDMSPDSGINELAGLSAEEQEKQKQEWEMELAKVEEEMSALRQVLAVKVKRSQELKRKLGFSVWKEFQDDLTLGVKNVKESNVINRYDAPINMMINTGTIRQHIYQKTESIVKTTAEKTTSLLGGLGSGLTSKLGQLKNSESFRSFEEKMGSAYENVKTKVSTSRSNSMQSFDDAVREETNRKSGISPATTPTINEEQAS
ncbi:tumor protein D54 isoform X1 [Nilaparvata lugens]|uniref:tumor protein D54 isoform X1 n=1 Tax=Nilaparvata lugens TaxID=108931 RepID=UPI000B9974CA|nr:tumor protein D54 isoform X1 [Nilaparvata lugens]